ncbi:MAG: DNA mismatch repair protein MutS [Tissierellia bacterium]|nr:DNA mismatch repair protein MutS [Tissierellia bacterium]
MKNLTPMMKQYMSIKQRHEDSILFFRLGDFYEMFFEDAIIASKELEIALTQRDCGNDEKAPMCGIPHHVSETYIARLVKKGYKVAICDQLEDPSQAKGIVKRDVVRIVTPGTITDTNVLDAKSNNYLAAIYFDDTVVGLSYVDSSTGEIYTTEHIGDRDSSYNFILDELGKIIPTEIICNRSLAEQGKIMRIIRGTIDPYINIYDEHKIRELDWNNIVTEHFKDSNLTGMKNRTYASLATGILIEYLYDTQKDSLEYINELEYYNSNEYMILDINTRANLEIHETIIDRQRKGALIWILDRTSTAMGGRLLKGWLEQPLINIYDIKRRQDIVETFVNDIILMNEVKDCLKQIYDLERLIGKISYGNCNARDLYSLKVSVSVIPALKSLLSKSDEGILIKLADQLDPLDDIFTLIDRSIVEDPPISIREGGLIKSDYDQDLDDLKQISTNGKEWLAELEVKEREKTGIKNLKVGFNRQSGYYFEVTKANLDLVPGHFIRRQTLTNSERYYTEQLKEIETRILGAEDEIVRIEYDIFQDIREKIKAATYRIQEVSKSIAQIDVLNSLGQVAYENDYVKPRLNSRGTISIIEGRHPVVEQSIENNLFVPNDTFIGEKNNLLQIITGPNMAGKSTYMRQVAIICLLAQVGSFVPAKEANLCILDRIFTRIGAADNLFQGESTFMVEMNEVSHIIDHATDQSLIILDEVGRGTSTHDGLSIAWAIIEYIAKNIRAKTMFATHYHELTELKHNIYGIENLTISVEEKRDEIIFLRKIIKGSTNNSYGIEVAKLAGINDQIIDRANEILYRIEQKQYLTTAMEEPVKKEKQLDLLDYKKDYFINRIVDLDITKLTPIDAINVLHDLTKEAKRLGNNEGKM